MAAALVLLCAVVALEWYAHAGANRAAPQPVRQIAAASPAPRASRPSPSPAPLVFVAVSATPQPAPPATGAPSAASPSATPYSVHTTPIAEQPMTAATIGPRAIDVPPVREPPEAPPRILSMSLSSPVAHGGQVLSGTVRTSSNVASVEARIGGYSSAMQKVGVGLFALSYRVPNLPFFLHRTYTVEVIARNARGDAVRSEVPITVQ